MQPTLLIPLLRATRVAKAVARIIRVQQILNDSSALPQVQARVRVFDCRDTTIGVDGLEGLLLEVAEVHDGRVVREVELIEDDGYLPWVGPL